MTTVSASVALGFMVLKKCTIYYTINYIHNAPFTEQKDYYKYQYRCLGLITGINIGVFWAVSIKSS